MIRVYVTNLGKYNEGFLIGKWLELPTTQEEIIKTLDEIGINEGYEEYFLSDWENDYGVSLNIGEYTPVSQVNEMAEKLKSLDRLELDTVIAYLEAVNNDIDQAIEALENGELELHAAETLEDLAYEFVDEGLMFGDISDKVKSYLDYASIGRDLGYEGFMETSKGILYCA